MVNLERNPKLRVAQADNEEHVPDALIREPLDPKGVLTGFYISIGEPVHGKDLRRVSQNTILLTTWYPS